MLSNRQIEVGEDTFTLLQYPTSKALSYGISIGKIAGAMLAGGLDTDLDTEEDQNDPFGGLDAGKMVEGLLSQIDEARTPELIKAMLKDAITAYTVKGQTRTAWDDAWYEDRFAGALEDLVTVLVAIFQDNFVAVVEIVKKKAGKARATRARSSASGNGAAPSPTPDSPPLESTGSFFE